MSSWRDELKESMKSPAERRAEATRADNTRRERRNEALAIAMVRTVDRAFGEIARSLGGKIGYGWLSDHSEITLDHRGSDFKAKRDLVKGSIQIVVDGNVRAEFAWDPETESFGWAGTDRTAELDEEVGKLALAWLRERGVVGK